MAKKRVFVDIDEDVVDTINSLKNQVLKDADLTYFRLNTGSNQAWMRFIISMGLIKIKEDFDKWRSTIEK